MSMWMLPARETSTLTAASRDAGISRGFWEVVVNRAPAPSYMKEPYAYSGDAVGTNVVASPRATIATRITQSMAVFDAAKAVAADVARIVPPASVGVPVWWRISTVRLLGVSAVVIFPCSRISHF